MNAPATREDLARWWATTPARGGRLIQSLGDEVATVSVEGTPMFMLVEHVAVKRAAEDEAERLADFLGGKLELSWTS